MPARQTLLKIEEITDCDTGMYQIGELDIGVYSGLVADYLKHYGYDGRKALMNEIGTLAAHVDRLWQEVQMENRKATPSQDKAGS